MDYEYQKYPISVVSLAAEINRVINDYNARRISNDDLYEIIYWYAHNCADLLFCGQDYITSIKKICGQRRIRLINSVLSGLQFSFFKEGT